MGNENDFSVRINGIYFILQEEVFDLIHNISKEKDHYKKQVDCSNSSKGHDFEEIPLSNIFDGLKYIKQCKNCKIQMV